MVPEIFLPYLFVCYYVRDFKTVFFHYGQTIVNCTLNLIRDQRMLDSIGLQLLRPFSIDHRACQVIDSGGARMYLVPSGALME